MTNLQMNQKLGPIYQTLNGLSVSGRNNVRALAAVLIEMEAMLQETMEAAKEETEEPSE